MRGKRGGGTPVTGANGTPATGNTPYQTTTLNIIVKDTAKSAPTPTTSLKHMRRLMVTCPSIVDDQNRIVQFTTPADFMIGPGAPAAPASLTVPVANNCAIELLDYDVVGNGFSNYTSVWTETLTNGTFKNHSTPIAATETITKPYSLVKYARQVMSIVAGGPNTVTLQTGTVTAPVTNVPAITANMTSAGTNTCTIGATIPVTTPFDPANWQYTRGYTANLASGNLSPKITTASSTLTSPLAFYNRALQTEYFVGFKFFLKDSLIRTTDAGAFYLVIPPASVSLNSDTFTIPPYQ